VPPGSNARSPTLNSPSRAWSASKGNRVFDVATRHIGLTGRSVDGIPTTGIAPAFASVTRAFRTNPQSISKTPIRTQGDRTARITSHRIAHDSHSQIAGYCVHANSCAAERRFTVHLATMPKRFCGQDKLGGHKKSQHNHKLQTPMDRGPGHKCLLFSACGVVCVSVATTNNDVHAQPLRILGFSRGWLRFLAAGYSGHLELCKEPGLGVQDWVPLVPLKVCVTSFDLQRTA